MGTIDAMQRDAQVSQLASDDVWDILIIGGGATGLGAALDAASRGYRTLLLEASDFAKGTSSRSTKLIHGGVRYLRSGQVSMVRESLRERSRLLDNAPHIVHSLQFVIPCYRAGVRWYYWFGMKAYDWLAGKLNVRPSQMLSRQQVREYLPTLAADGMNGGVLFSDGQFDDARLALALAQTSLDHGATLLNYAPVRGLRHEDGKIVAVECEDLESQTTYQVRCKTIINAAGVFGASIMAMDKPPSTGAAAPMPAPPSIVPSRGTHVVLRGDFLPTEYAILIPETDDGRVLFAIPWLGSTLIGTTDHPTSQIDLDPQPTGEEIDYLLEHVGRYLSSKPSRGDMFLTGANVEVASLELSGDEKKNTASLSREHEIYVSPSGLITVIGGKWTTYRKMGEDLVDLAVETGALQRRESKTRHLRLKGSDMDPTQFGAEDPLACYAASRGAIEKIIESDAALAATIHSDLPYQGAHVVWAVRHEMARTVDDVLSRRTRSLLLNARAAAEACPWVAKIMAQELGRDDHWQQAQVDEFKRIAERYIVRP